MHKVMGLRTSQNRNKPASVAQFDARPTGDQEVAGSTPAGSATLFVLRFYGPVNPMRPCRARSLVTRLLGILSPLSG